MKTQRSGTPSTVHRTDAKTACVERDLTNEEDVEKLRTSKEFASKSGCAGFSARRYPITHMCASRRHAP
jgi:hypothetical protein